MPESEGSSGKSIHTFGISSSSSNEITRVRMALRYCRNKEKKTWRTAKETLDTWVEILDNCA